MAETFPKLRLRIVLAPGVAFGPGKADLLEGIAETGSIRAAGNRLRMSYKRAWSLVGDMNRQFTGPLVVTEKGGSGGGGGSHLTSLGKDVLRRFRAIEQILARSADADVSALSQMVAPDLETEKVAD